MKKRSCEETHNDRMLVERFMARLPGFNRVRLAHADLLELCDANGIKVIQRPMLALHGSALYSAIRPYILINSNLSASEQLIAGFHELTHVIDQEIPAHTIRSSTGSLYNMNKSERQAQLVGVIALMPEPEARGRSVEDLMKAYGVSRELAEFRAALKL